MTYCLRSRLLIALLAVSGSVLPPLAFAQLDDATAIGPVFLFEVPAQPIAGPKAAPASGEFSLISQGYLSVHFGYAGNAGTQPFQITMDGDSAYVSVVGENVIRKFQLNDAGFALTQTIGAPGSGAGQFNGPEQVAIVGNDLFVADFSNSRIQRFNKTTGAYISQFGSFGTGLGQLSSPSGLVYNPRNGRLYVGEVGNDRIQMFSTSGSSLGAFGTPGSGNGQLNNPYVLAVDSQGNIYAADSTNNRVAKFTSNGTWLRHIGVGIAAPLGLAVDAADHVWVGSSTSNDLYNYDHLGNYLAYYYGSGTTGVNGYFGGLRGIAVQRPMASAPFLGRPAIVAVDLDAGTLQSFEASAQPTAHAASGSLTSIGTFQGQIAVDAQGNAYITSHSANRVYKYDRLGNLVTSWGSTGTGNGQFGGAYGITVDDSGNVYVADRGNNRIQKFDSAGSYLLQWGSTGSGNGQFNGPAMLATDGSWIYATDESNHRVQKFSLTGTYVRQWGTNGTGNSQFQNPAGITVDRHRGQVYVAEFTGNRIQQFSEFGDFVKVITESVSGTGALNGPRGLTTDQRGNLYCADGNNARVVQYNDNGTYLGTISVTGVANGLGMDANIGRLYVGTTGGTEVFKFGAVIGRSDTLGVYRPSAQSFLMRNVLNSGPATLSSTVTGAIASDQPLVGDWNGDGIDTPGLFRTTTGTFYLWDRWANVDVATPDYSFTFGGSGNTAFVIDWNADGLDDIGLHETASNTNYIRDRFYDGVAVFAYSFGSASDIALGGDWNGDGWATPAVFSPAFGQFTLSNALFTGIIPASGTKSLGPVNAKPVVGDWAHAGFKQVGSFHGPTATFTQEGDGTTLSFVYAPSNPGVLFKDGFEQLGADSVNDIPLGGTFGPALE
ncbi:hypothetical protein [Ahniella affigens]|nr:hypothetical protein [Ahniella affigens]